MPRAVQEILDHADELARGFDDYEPSASDRRDPEAFAAVPDALITRSEAERPSLMVAHAGSGDWAGAAGPAWSGNSGDVHHGYFDTGVPKGDGGLQE